VREEVVSMNVSRSDRQTTLSIGRLPSGGTVPPVPAAAGKVLVVDDQPAVLFLVQQMLGKLGMTCAAASSGEEALRQLRDQDFALIVMDVHMPGLNGFETAARARAQERSRHTPILLFTGYDQGDRFLAERDALGVVDFMMKPITLQTLRSKVTGLLARVAAGVPGAGRSRDNVRDQ
jgi:CheY-like chemotaxis protein